jgi:crotonobetainyl-CoA:carnitine CoA-transferase CaiB-like acyl-CoA transferase
MSVNRNKKSIILDLKFESAQKVFLDLSRKADVIFENFRPGVMKRLNIDYETVRKVNPKIIYLSLSGFGADGPLWNYPAFDLSVQAMGGGMSITGEPERPPCRAGIPIGDLAGGMFASHAILAALYNRQREGSGQWIDMSLLDGQISLLTYMAGYYFISGIIPQPIGSGHQTAVPYGAFKTKDYYIVIPATNDTFFLNLCKAFGKEEKAKEPGFRTQAERTANRDAVNAFVEEFTILKTNDEWMEILGKANIPAAPVLTIDQALSNEQVKWRNMVVEMEHCLGGTVRFPNTPFTRMHGVDSANYTCPPLLGQHTDNVLRDLLGYGEEKVKKLREEGAVK